MCHQLADMWQMLTVMQQLLTMMWKWNDKLYLMWYQPVDDFFPVYCSQLVDALFNCLCSIFTASSVLAVLLGISWKLWEIKGLLKSHCLIEPGECTVGEILNKENLEQCDSCGYDSYQPNPKPKNGTECRPCGKKGKLNLGTKQERTANKSQCLCTYWQIDLLVTLLSILLTVARK